MVCLLTDQPEVQAQLDKYTNILGSYDAAYYVLSENNGFDLDKTLKGQPSKLFSDLLSHYNGDEAQAIRAKAKLFTNSFRNWFGDWINAINAISSPKQDNDAIDYLFSINPQLEQIGTREEYQQYINSIFPDSQVDSVYWHGTDSDFNQGLENATRGKGSGAPETRGEMYFNKQPWASLQYISGVNRNITDKNGFNNWVKLWWELKEILGNGRLQNDDWKNLVIGPDVRQEIPNKRGVFNRNQGGSNGKYLRERKADYGYENKSDKEFFEEVFGIKYGKDTFQDWVDRNADKFKQIWNSRSVKKGIYPAILNVQNPIVEEGQNTYYEEQRGLMTRARRDGNDAIISNRAKNEFSSDVIVMLNPQQDVHILGTNQDLEQFKQWKQHNNVSKVVDENGEPLVVYHGGAKDITEFRISSEDGNTARGYYTDKVTGEKIPVDSARTVFFSDNQYVGVSYGTLLAIQTYQNLAYKVDSLLHTVRDGSAGIDTGVFKTLDSFLDTLTALSEFNPRFQRLREYISEIRQKGQRLNPREVEAFRQLLLDVRKEVRKLGSEYLMNRPDWLDVLNTANKVLKHYNTKEGREKLLKGEIPEYIQKEWTLYKKIEAQREKQGLPKIGNYEELHLALTRSSRYYFVYDGDKLKIWNPFYSDPNVEDLTDEQLKEFLDNATQINQANIKEVENEPEYVKLKRHWQLYPTFLNIKNPLVHDYEGTHQGQGYKQSQTYTFGYVAARQVNKAIKDGNDGVIYENIYDPILANNYAVFNPNQIKSINNRGTFSTQDNNIYYKEENNNEEVYNQNVVQEIGEFSNSKQLIDYLLKQDGIRNDTKQLLRNLYNTPAQIIIRDFLPQGSNSNAVAFYDGAINLVVDRLQNSSMQTIAEDVAHEMLHHYLQKYYNTNEQFQEYLRSIQNKYKKYFHSKKLPYGLRKEDSPIEFLNEFMSNHNLRRDLRFNTPSLFYDIINTIIAIFRKLFTGKKTKLKSLNPDLQNLEQQVYNLLDDVNVGEISTYSIEDNPYEVQYKIDDDQQKQINSTYERIQRGLKDRLKSVKRYSTKNPRLWNQLSTVISQLANSEAEQGILQFLQHISDTIVDAVKFLQKPIDEINAKQIRQLSQDYVGFYKPLLDDIIYLFDTTDLFKDLPNYPELQRNAQRLSTEMDQIYNRFTHLLKAKGISELVNYLKSNNVPQSYIDKTLEWLNNPANDISIFINWFGMASNSNNMVTQAIAKMLNDTMNQTQRETMSKGIELVKLVQIAKEKYGTDVQKLLYEKLNDGTYSGYRVRPINYGQYKKDKQEYLDKLAQKLGISKDKDGSYQLPNDEDIQKKWYDGINKFYSERVNRRYTSEYYTTRNKMLSIKTRQALDEIQDYIDSIISRVTIDGVQHDELLTQSEYQQVLLLKRQKQLLANKYNLDGSIKTGDDLIIANELSAFNEEVNKKVKREVDWDSYNRDHKKIIEQYGKDDPRTKLWEARNTKQRYTDAFYERIAALNKTPQTKLYEDLIQKRRELMQLFKNPETGLVDVSTITDEQKAQLLQLDKDIANSRTISDTNPEEETDSFKNFAEVVYTDEYYKDYKEARDAGVDQFNQWYSNNHYEDAYGRMRPASYYTRLKPKDEVADRYTETVPTGRYTKLDPTSDWYNPDFDNNGPSIQPKKQYYDNSKAYNEVMNKPEVKALYEAIIDTMLEANSYIPFLNSADDGRMSQMPARFAQVWARMSGITNKLKYAIDEVVSTQADDYDYVEEFSTMPNGDPIKVIPTRFIKMLDNPNAISTDAVTATIAYYNMAVNFKNMQNHQDDIELMLGLLKGITIRNKKGIIQPGNSNLYKQAQLLVDRLMYGRNMNQVTANVFGKEFNITKMATMLLDQIRKVNLSGNIWSIGTSFFTDSTYTTLEAKLGRYFDKEDLSFAIQEYSRRLPNIMENVGNPVPNDKLSYLMLLNQVVRDNREVFDRLDQSQVLRGINNNFWYLGYTQSDYLVKSHTLMSVYHNYRLVDGKFMSKAEFLNTYYPNDRKAGKVAFKQLQITAFDAYNEDGTIKEEYKDKITTKLLNDIKNRIEILSKRIDGTLREVDKAQIHANFLGQYVVMHKNFMIQGLHDRFKKRQFNLDTGVEEAGYYRSMGKFLYNIVGNRHFGLTQLLADYNQLEEYEQYAVSRVLHEMALFTSATLVALSLAALVDGDDDYDNWFMQSLTYLALRSAFEFRTMYNPMEFLSMIKSPTAAFTWFDNASAFINLFNPFSYIGNGGPFEIIDRGVYKGMPRVVRNIIKVTPIRSIIEAGDPQSKRSYLQNQLMSF